MPTIISSRVTISRQRLQQKLERFGEVVGRVDSATEKLAMVSLGRLVNATPIRYTGNTRKGWVHRQTGSMSHILANPNKVMRFLEHGTKAHGPKNAKALFIPLNVRAFHAGPKGVMQANAQARASGQWLNYGARVRGDRMRRVRMPYQQGLDYLFVKRVKGIRAHHIARDEQRRVRRELKSIIKTELKSALR